MGTRGTCRSRRGAARPARLCAALQPQPAFDRWRDADLVCTLQICRWRAIGRGVPVLSRRDHDPRLAARLLGPGRDALRLDPCRIYGGDGGGFWHGLCAGVDDALGGSTSALDGRSRVVAGVLLRGSRHRGGDRTALSAQLRSRRLAAPGTRGLADPRPARLRHRPAQGHARRISHRGASAGRWRGAWPLVVKRCRHPAGDRNRHRTRPRPDPAAGIAASNPRAFRCRRSRLRHCDPAARHPRKPCRLAALQLRRCGGRPVLVLCPMGPRDPHPEPARPAPAHHRRRTAIDFEPAGPVRMPCRRGAQIGAWSGIA